MSEGCICAPLTIKGTRSEKQRIFHWNKMHPIGKRCQSHKSTVIPIALPYSCFLQKSIVKSLFNKRRKASETFPGRFLLFSMSSVKNRSVCGMNRSAAGEQFAFVRYRSVMGNMCISCARAYFMLPLRMLCAEVKRNAAYSKGNRAFKGPEGA